MASGDSSSGETGAGSMDVVDFGRYAGGLLVTLGLIALLAFAARRLDWRRVAGGGRTGRLSVVETVMIDTRRRAALIRFDGREHLVLLGAAGETLIESRDAPNETGPDAKPAGTPDS